MATKDNEAAAIQPPPVAANDQAAEPTTELTLQQLAAGVIAREVRPRAQDIRRLAEAVLAGSAKPAKAPKAKKAKPDGGGKKKKKASEARKSAEKKLAKIPGGKAKK